MTLNNNELMKVFDFVLENKNIVDSDNSLFNWDTLVNIRATIKGISEEKFELTENDKQLIIDTFIKSSNAFSKDTPNFIMENLECINIALQRDINSANYIPNIPSNLESYIIDEASKREFILNVYSPNFLTSNFSIALNSIKSNPSSFDFVEWDSMSDDQIDILVDEAIKGGYILTSDSCYFAKNNVKIVLHSIKKDISTINFADYNIKRNPIIFKHLFLNDYDRYNLNLKDRTLNCFLDYDVIAKAFDNLKIYNTDSKKYIENFNKLYYDALNNRPLIKDFDSVFQYVAESEWNVFRDENSNNFDNIFGKISAELRNSNNFDYIMSNLEFLPCMRSVLADDYHILYDAMYQYFNIYHNETDNKFDKIEVFRDTISRLSALYVAKSKENYKKKILKNCYEFIFDYFTLDLDNPDVNRKILYSQKKDNFKYLYKMREGNIREFANDLANTYSYSIGYDTALELINNFILFNYTTIDETIDIPDGYDSYIRYKKAIKLINRLNSGYIQYDGVEVANYKDIISFSNNKYIYTGRTFTNKELEIYKEYSNKTKIFEKIKKDIISKIQSMETPSEINDNIIDDFMENLPFTDEYFKFDSKCVFNTFNFRSFINSSIVQEITFDSNIFTSEKFYPVVHNLFVKNGWLWLLIFANQSTLTRSVFERSEIDKNFIFEIINNIEKILNIANDFNFNINNFNELAFVNKICKYVNTRSMVILDKDILEKLYKHLYCDNSMYNIINSASELVCKMATRNNSTVPYINGETLNYKYSLYDSHDTSILTCGIDTDSCFRIDGYDNDFLYYCALDKNGFVIKITDSFDNFIGKASGFRNGNCVFINQLRTIYDEGGNIYNGEYENEKKEIIEAFKKACEDIISISQNNSSEIDKIDFVFVTQSYSLTDYDSNVSNDIENFIGEPINLDCDDWKEFIYNTRFLSESDYDCPFETDYGNYSLICMASSKKDNINKDDLIFKDVPAVYERKRNKIIITDNPSVGLCKKINNIEAIKSYLTPDDFTFVEIPESSVVFIGDNWYIIYNNGEIVKSCLLDDDSKAKIEFEATKQILEQYMLNDNQSQLDIKQLTKNLKLETNYYN